MKGSFSHLLSLLLVLMMLLSGAAASAENVWDHSVVYTDTTETAVAEKVKQLTDECIASGAEGDFEIAVWLHNWLINNADYDETYTEYGADGVLLKGTGVCQSYTLAYGLLLDEMGIENQMVVSKDMNPNHSWNLVKMEGNWYHVDCTWDDPIGDGGSEQHTYFGLSDALMSRDHNWETADYPACTSTSCHYYIRTGDCAVVSNQEELNAAIQAQLAEGNTQISLYNISTEDFLLFSALDEWFERESWKYGLTEYSYSGSDYYTTIELSGYDPSVRSVEYMDDEGLESELIAALAAGAETVYVYDHSGKTFDSNALFKKAYAIILANAPEHGCVIEGNYRYSLEGMFILFNVSYIDANALPEPFALSESPSSAELTITTSDGVTMSSSNNGRAIWVFSPSTSSYTTSLLGYLNAGTSTLKKADVSVFVGFTDFASGTDVQTFVDFCPYFTFGSAGDSFWNALVDFGYDIYNVGIAYPAVFIQDSDGTLIYVSTGSGSESMRLIATAVDGHLPIVYDNVLVLPSALRSIEAAAFEGSTEFQEVRFSGTQVTSIEANAFKDCTALKRITIPDSVTSIDASAFNGCSDLVICSSEDAFAHEYAIAYSIEWKSAD